MNLKEIFDLWTHRPRNYERQPYGGERNDTWEKYSSLPKSKQKEVLRYVYDGFCNYLYSERCVGERSVEILGSASEFLLQEIQKK